MPLTCQKDWKSRLRRQIGILFHKFSVWNSGASTGNINDEGGRELDMRNNMRWLGGDYWVNNNIGGGVKIQLIMEQKTWGMWMGCDRRLVITCVCVFNMLTRLFSTGLLSCTGRRCFPGLNELPSSFRCAISNYWGPGTIKPVAGCEAMWGHKGILVLSPDSTFVFLRTRSKLAASLAHLGVGALRARDASLRGKGVLHVLTAATNSASPDYHIQDI